MAAGTITPQAQKPPAAAARDEPPVPPGHRLTLQANNAIQPLITTCQGPAGSGQTLANLNELAAALTAMQATIATLITQATDNP
jgi:hypothetical protein